MAELLLIVQFIETYGAAAVENSFIRYPSTIWGGISVIVLLVTLTVPKKMLIRLRLTKRCYC
jgi:hypothetical protein